MVVEAGVVFEFDRHGPNDIRPYSAAQLDRLLARLRAEGLVVTAVRLSGHADRLNGTGSAAYNQRLSEQRAATVRERLAAAGIDRALIATAARGDAQPVATCNGRFASQAELTECLLPDRRVDVVIEAAERR